MTMKFCTHHDSYTVMWHLQNFIVISLVYHKLEHSKFLSNSIEITLVGLAPTSGWEEFHHTILMG